ncbi:MAG: response regulator [Nitrospira sp.]|nr:response regulator [Nitrospira sp.]
MPTILVVDDDQQVRLWLRQLLEAKGHTIEEAGDGYAALTYLERAEPALVVLDLFMPNVEGLEIILHLRTSARPLKVLAISGNPLPAFDACVVAKVFGACDALAKPFDAPTFLNHVDTLLAHS